MAINKKTLSTLEIFGILIAILVGITGIITFFTDWLPCKPFAVCQPRITFVFPGSMDPGEPVYEVAEGIYYSGELGSTEVVIYAEYDGKEYGERVVVELVNSDGIKQEVGRWDNFRTDHLRPLSVTITPEELMKNAGLPAGNDAYTWLTAPDQVNRGQFKIQAVTLDGREVLGEKVITVLHTPWLHQTQLSTSVTSGGRDVKVFLSARNLGNTSNFNIEAYIYDATELDPETLASQPDGWWVAKSWPEVVYSHIEMRKIAENSSEEFGFTIPGSALTGGHVYVLTTVAYKELPYLKITDDSWEKSDEKWRYRDHLNLDTIVVLK